MDRRKYLSSQLGSKIKDPGVHMGHPAVGLILKNRRKKDDLKVSGKEVLTGKTKVIERYNPFPLEFQRENL